MAAFTNLDSREMTGTRRISAGSTQPTSSVRTATAPISSLTSPSGPMLGTPAGESLTLTRQLFNQLFVIPIRYLPGNDASLHWILIVLTQASLGQAQTYLVKGLSDRTVAAYYKYMVNVAVLMGAERSVAERELKDSIEFEMELARASTPREMRRDSNRMYNPMMIR